MRVPPLLLVYGAGVSAAFGLQPFDAAPYFACPQHCRCGGCDVYPFHERERFGAEYAAAEGHYYNLAGEYQQCGQQETPGVAGVAEGGVRGAEYARIEQVPELKHHEDGEEYREVVGVHSRGGGVEVGKQPHEDGEEAERHAEDVVAHGGGDDEVAPAARLFVHHIGAGRQRSQCHGRKGVHDEVDPQHLCDGKRKGRPEEGANQNAQQRHNVDGQLEDYEALDVLVERTAPHHGSGYAAERVVEQGDVAGLLGYGCAGAHGESDLCMVEGRSVVRAVARDCHDGSLLLQELHEALLVHGAGAAHYLQVENAVESLLVAEGGELGAGDAVAFGVFGCPETYLAGYLGSGAGGVAGDYLDAYAGRLALPYGCRNIGTYRVADGEDAEEREAAFGYEFGAVGRRTFRNGAECYAEGTHGHVLVVEQLLLIGCPAVGVDAAVRHDYFRRSLDIQHAPVENGRLHKGGHVLALRGEGELVDRVHFGTHPDVVVALVAEPEQQRHFGGVAHAGGFFARALLFEECGGVGRYALRHHIGKVALEARLVNLHEVLGEGAGLVGAYYRDGAHGLAGVHLAHEVVGLQHAAHVEGKAQGDAHGKPLRYGYDYQCDGHHEILEHDVGYVEPLLPAGHGIHAEVGIEVLAGEDEEREDGYREAGAPDELCKARQLDVERGLFEALLGGLACHLAYFRGVADAVDAHDAVAVGDGGAAHDGIGGIGGFGIECRLVDGLVDHQLAGERRFVDLQRHCFQQRAVGGDFVACVEQDGVAHDNILAGYLLDLAVADDRYGGLLAHCVEKVELAPRIIFEIEAYAGGEENGEKDAYGLGIFSLDYGYDKREAGGHEEHLNDGVPELFQVELQHGRPFGRREKVLAVFAAAFENFAVGEARQFRPVCVL